MAWRHRHWKERGARSTPPFGQAQAISIIQMVPSSLERATQYGVYRKSHPVQAKKAGSIPAQENAPTQLMPRDRPRSTP